MSQNKPKPLDAATLAKALNPELFSDDRAKALGAASERLISVARLQAIEIARGTLKAIREKHGADWYIPVE